MTITSSILSSWTRRLFLGLGLFAGFLPAQQAYDIQEFGLANGLPSRVVSGITRDRQGFRWLGTEGGLCRFDGQNFVAFPQLPDENYQGQTFNGPLVLDRYNRIIAVPLPQLDSVEVFSLEDFKVAKPPKGAKSMRSLPGKFVHFTGRDQSDFYQLRRQANTATIYRLDENMAWQLVYTLSGLSTYYPNQLDRFFSIADGHYLFFDAGHNSFRRITNHHQTTFAGPGQSPAWQPIVHHDRAGRTWFIDGPNRHVYCKLAEEPAFSRVLQLEALIPSPETAWWNRIWEDETGHLIFSAGSKTYRTALARIAADLTVTNLNGILGRESKFIAIAGYDFTKLIELATFAGYYTVKTERSNLAVTNYLDTVLLPGEFGFIIRGFTETPDQTTYLNTEGNQWFRLRYPDYELEKIAVTESNGQPLSSSTSCGGNLIAHQGYIYGMSCRLDNPRSGWINRYDHTNQTWYHYPIPEEGAFGRFMLLDTDHSFLLFTLNHHTRSNNIYRFYPQSGDFECIAEVDAEEPELSKKGGVSFALPDSINGGIWIATSRALHYFNPAAEPSKALLKEQKSGYFEVSPIPYPGGKVLYLSDLELLPDGKLLVASSDGLLLFNPPTGKFTTVGYDRSKQFEASEGVVELPNNFVAEIVKLNPRYYLITTYHGMVVMDWQTRQSLPYDNSDGLPSNEFNRLAGFVNTENEVFIGGINGFSRISLNDLLPTADGPVPVLSRVFSATLNNREEEYLYLPNSRQVSLVLPPNLLYLGIDLALPSAKNPGGGFFQSWLEGFELDYSPISPSAHLKYDLLPAGNYTLHVRGFTAEGQQSSSELTVPIRVMKPWYLRLWFLIGSQLLLLLLGYLLYLSRVKRVERAAVEKQLAERQVVELELKILRQQLNPHFIFNALGAIQHFIQQKESQIATDYLADFAKLMRMFLESSKQSFIFIRDEVELIRLYTSLEQLRFNHRFDVLLEVDENIDQDMEDIPSLLLQPFVENAINHGLFHLPTQGELHISIRAGGEEKIICQISDNGIGRKKAAEIQQNSFRKHKSRATQIVEERLSISEKAGETTFKITTEDLYPEREFTGTRVTIVIA